MTNRQKTIRRSDNSSNAIIRRLQNVIGEEEEEDKLSEKEKSLFPVNLYFSCIPASPRILYSSANVSSTPFSSFLNDFDATT